MKLRIFLAIIVCKAVKLLSKIIHRGGTAKPGEIALKFCPYILKYLARDVKCITVTGTNGKTTCTSMIHEAQLLAGRDSFSNKSGANLISGIVTVFVENCTITGKMKKHYAVIECDEGASKNVFAQLQPEVIVVTNLFDDQLDRYGSIKNTLANIREGISKSPDSTLILNADCALVASLGRDLSNKKYYFGVNAGALPQGENKADSDAVNCLYCGEKYDYSYIVFDHLGGFKCPKCGWSRPDADWAVTEVKEQTADSSTVVLASPEGRDNVTISLPAVYNIYNAAAAVAAAVASGVEKSTAIVSLADFKCCFGRMERFDLGEAGARMMLVKNTAGCNQVIDYLDTVDGSYDIILILNSRVSDGTDPSWIFQADFEKIIGKDGKASKVIISGDKADVMYDRIRATGIPEERLTIEKDYDKLIDMLSVNKLPIYIIPVYTAMLEVRSAIVKHCGGEEFWE